MARVASRTALVPGPRWSCISRDVSDLLGATHAPPPIRVSCSPSCALALGGCPPLPPGLRDLRGGRTRAAPPSPPPRPAAMTRPPRRATASRPSRATATTSAPAPRPPRTRPATRTGSTTDQPVLPPQIVDGVVIPDYIDENGLLDVEVTTQGRRRRDDAARQRRPDRSDADRPRPVRRTNSAFTALDNGKRHKLC
jgi:hypothetical protein